MRRHHALVITFVLAVAALPPLTHAEGPQTKPSQAADEVIESDPVKLTPEALKRFDVRTEAASTTRRVGTFTAPARVTLNQEATVQVGSPVSGRVSDVKVRAGDPVNKGDVLVVIESAELGEAQSDYLQRKTELSVAGSNLELARSAYDRAKKLLEKSQGISLTEVQKREAELKSAVGAERVAKGAVAAATNRLKLLGVDAEAIKRIEESGVETSYTLRAPLSGEVVERSITLGELVKPDRESVLVLSDLTTLWVIVDVPEMSLADVAKGGKAKLTFPSLRGKSIDGTVAYVASRLDESTRTVPVRVEIRPQGLPVLPGMFAEAEISAPAEAEALLSVPEEAVQTVEGHTSVFVPVKGVPGAFVARRVETTRPLGGLVAVTKGLRVGEQFVVSGSFILKAELGKGSVQEE